MVAQFDFGNKTYENLISSAFCLSIVCFYANLEYMQNIHFDGSQRYDIEETKKKYKNVYSQDSNLTSVYNLLKDIQPKRTEVKQQIKEQKLVRSSISVN